MNLKGTMRLILMGCGVFLLAYLGFLLYLWVMLAVFTSPTVKAPDNTIWFWECRQHDVYGKPFLPGPDVVGRAPDQTRCGEKS